MTILAVLSALLALAFMAATAVAFFGFALTTNASFIQALKDAGASQWVVDNIGLILMVTAVVSLIFMIVYFLLAFGFWGGRRWAWGLGVVFGIISIIYTVVNFVVFPGVTGIASLIISILIPLIILVYLMQPGVKRFFKGNAQAPPAP